MLYVIIKGKGLAYFGGILLLLSIGAFIFGNTQNPFVQNMNSKSPTATQPANSFAAPEIVNFQSETVGRNIEISFELLNPTSQTIFTGSVVRLTCIAENAETIMFMMLISARQSLDENMKRLSGMTIDQTVVLDGVLEPGKSMPIKVQLNTSVNSKITKCTRISMRGAW